MRWKHGHCMGMEQRHTLREAFTIKSDDINGRNSLYNSIVNTKKVPRPHLTESFKVFIKEFRGYALMSPIQRQTIIYMMKITG